jgi:excisionase family DNA binding protein
MSLLTVKQAAERAGVSVALVYDWVAGGLLAHHRLGRPGRRGCIRVAQADLDAFLAAQRREGAAPAAAPPRKPPVRLRHLDL